MKFARNQSKSEVYLKLSKRTIRETGRKIPYATTCEFCEKIFKP